MGGKKKIAAVCLFFMGAGQSISYGASDHAQQQRRGAQSGHVGGNQWLGARNGAKHLDLGKPR